MLSPRHEDEAIDDVSIGLQVQQFLDEWLFRVLHSGLAADWDRPQALIKALDIFEAAGMQISQEEKIALSEMEEDDMICAWVKFVPTALRKTLEPFLLQMQLVLSTATRVRSALEDGSPEEITRLMEDADTGITMQILKEVVVTASQEIGEIQDVHASWHTSTILRVARLARCADDAVEAKRNFERLSAQMADFGRNQNAKTTQVLSAVLSGQDKTLLHLAFWVWHSGFAKDKVEKELHEQSQKEVQNAHANLLAYKMERLAHVRVFMKRSGAQSDERLIAEVLAAWKLCTHQQLQDRELQTSLLAMEDKLKNEIQRLKDNARHVMESMTSGVDDALLRLCWGEWLKEHAVILRIKAADAAVKVADDKLQDYLKRKRADAFGIMVRMAEASEEALVGVCFGQWADEYRDARLTTDALAALDAKDQKFTTMRAIRKNAGMHVAWRHIKSAELNMAMQMFMAWHAETKMKRVLAHYAHKMEGKEEKFQAVQGMIRNFASQLESGLGSPRSQKSRSRPPAA